MEQIVLNFDATGFEGYESCREYFVHSTHTVKDDQGRRVFQKTIAMEMDYSPSHWSQKLGEAGDSRITLNDAEQYSEKFGDVRWIHYLVYKHIVKKKKNREQLLRLKEEIERELAAEAR